jgi:hypothetical protein
VFEENEFVVVASEKLMKLDDALQSDANAEREQVIEDFRPGL